MLSYIASNPTKDLIEDVCKELNITILSQIGEIDFLQVKNSGIDFVYIKSSEGQNTVDSYFRRNYEEARSNGLNIGFYHYVRARTTEEARLEAEHFANTIAGTVPTCKLAMDFENFGNLSIGEINEISKVFLERVQ